MRGFFFIGVTAILLFPLRFGLAAETSTDGVSPGIQTNRSELSLEDPLPVVPAAKSLVLERLVPTKKITDIPLLRATMRVPRDIFVPKGFQDDAYTDLPIPLGSGQTLASPFETLYALQQLNLYPSDQVLVIGPGVGYSAAIAAQLADRITAEETLPSLLRLENDAVKKLALKNVRIRGVSPEQAKKETDTFDKILVLSSFPDNIPQWLIDRLNKGGVLAAPIGTPEIQRLCLFTKNETAIEKAFLIGICPVSPFAVPKRSVSLEKDAVFLEESFEYPTTESELFIPGWFNLRNATLLPASTSPSGHGILCLDSAVVQTEQKRKDALRRKELADEKARSDNSTEIPDFVPSLLTLRQREAERITLAIRAFRLNGKKTRKISFTCQMEGVGLVSEKKSLRSVITSSLVFFDENRTPLQEIPLTALKTGDTPCQEYHIPSIAVPKKAREAELRVGLFTGHGVLKVGTIVIKEAKSPKEQ